MGLSGILCGLDIYIEQGACFDMIWLLVMIAMMTF